MNSIWRDRFYTILSIVLLLILWKGISLFIGWEILLPSPEETFMNLTDIISTNIFFIAVLNTALKSIIGFMLALVLALFMGTIAGIFKPIYYLFSPLSNVIKASPTIALVLLSLIWLGSEKTPILVGFLVIFPILYFNIIEGIKNVDNDLIEMAEIYKVPQWIRIKELYLPSIFSYIMAGATTAIGLNVKVVIAAEVLSQSMNSVGEQMHLEKFYLNTAGVFAWTIVAIMMASSMEFILQKIQITIEKWK